MDKGRALQVWTKFFTNYSELVFMVFFAKISNLKMKKSFLLHPSICKILEYTHDLLHKFLNIVPKIII